ncbi:3-hydroxybenzoate 6-monooxygenase [Sphingomonas sp. SRS2]|uniref:3-hydroxybenzoate 6-monooxygenase n=1 Tax=Sphingomonas sp. SRS2 TaxID=133190 RepID=UPI0009FE3ECD|nr:3-hydroxybenzoate 6-monooxygenase [Sphingomonas sp. SRS2]
MANGPVIICGGGIGGLSAALGLAKFGVRSIVLERAPQIAEIGAGIQLGPNAFHIFDFFGIGAAVRETAVFIDRCRLMDAISAEQITELTIDEAFLARFQNPYAVVHRAELHSLILQGCRASGLVEFRTNAEVVGYEQGEGEAAAILASGDRVRGRAVIGADGLWSSIRSQLVNDGAPRVTGHTTYRAVIPVEDMPEQLRWNDMALWAGPKCHIVHYPLSGWKLFNLVVTYHNHAPEPVSGVPVDAAEVLLGFEDVHELPRQVISIARDWRKWVLCDRAPLMNWTQGRVTLLGDAAHPTMQYMAQGACMAMEDGAVLASEIAQAPDDVPAALQRYQERRLLRTARIVLLSREMGDHVLHATGAHAALRNNLMGRKSQAEWHEILDWLYRPGCLGDDIVQAASSDCETSSSSEKALAAE